MLVKHDNIQKGTKFTQKYHNIRLAIFLIASLINSCVTLYAIKIHNITRNKASLQIYQIAFTPEEQSFYFMLWNIQRMVLMPWKNLPPQPSHDNVSQNLLIKENRNMNQRKKIIHKVKFNHKLMKDRKTKL